MVIKSKRYIFYGLLLFSIIGCKTKSLEHSANHQSTALKLRHQIDTVGFAQYAWQMDSILNRIPEADKKNNGRVYKAVICPHDDYSMWVVCMQKRFWALRQRPLYWLA